MARCPSCGASVSPGDRFCGVCGHAQVSTEPPTTTGPLPGPSRSRSLPIIGLIVAGAVVLGIGVYQVIEHSAAPPPPRPAAQEPITPPPPPTAVQEPSAPTALPSAPAPAKSREAEKAPSPAVACANLVPSGGKIICSASEPNWAIELICAQSSLKSNFIDAFSGDSMEQTQGPVNLSRENPWVFRTKQGFEGSIASTPGACRDESDQAFDFTLTPTEVPGVLDPPMTTCCRIER